MPAPEHPPVHLERHCTGDLVGLKIAAFRRVPPTEHGPEFSLLEKLDRPRYKVGASCAERRCNGLQIVGHERRELVKPGNYFRPGEEDHNFGLFVFAKPANRLEDTETSGRWSRVHVVVELSRECRDPWGP